MSCYASVVIRKITTNRQIFLEENHYDKHSKGKGFNLLLRNRRRCDGKVLIKGGLLQHNLAYGTGREAFCGSVAYLGSAPVKTTVNTIRAFEDGDKVFMQTVYNFAGAGEQVAFDIFRFEDGLIAEHWDVMETIADKSTWQNNNGKF